MFPRHCRGLAAATGHYVGYFGAPGSSLLMVVSMSLGPVLGSFHEGIYCFGSIFDVPNE